MDDSVTYPGSTLERSWLVQRLERPRRHNPFSFGGGLRNGGLSDDAMKMLDGIFTFDYMGAAEFEWGKVPAALQHIAQKAAQGDIDVQSIDVPLTEVPLPWSTSKTKQDIKEDDVATIYVVAPTTYFPEIVERIQDLASEKARLKEGTRLTSALHDPTETEIAGWLEIDNGFFFTTDRTMFDKFTALMGIDVPEEAVE